MFAIQALITPASSITVEKIISREHPAFDTASARLVAGYDGRIYLSGGGHGGGYFLSLKPDGSDKFGRSLAHATDIQGASSTGHYALRMSHFAHTLAIFRADGTETGRNATFDNRNFDAPQWVEAGASGDFYAVDGHINRIVRIDVRGQVTGVYSISRYAPGNPDWITGSFRVSEAAQRFLITGYAQPLRLFDFAGNEIATLPVNGPHDMGENGVCYVLNSAGTVVKKFDADGVAQGEIALDTGGFTQIRVRGNNLYLRANDDRVLFHHYNLTTAQRQGMVYSDHERLAMTFESEVMTAGAAEAFTLEFDPGKQQASPIWQAWARPFDAPIFTRLSFNENTLSIPEHFGGLYVLRLCADPRAGALRSSYDIQTVIEVRRPNSQGTVNVSTPENRLYFGRGEHIPLAVVVRSIAAMPAQVSLSVTQGDTVLAQDTLSIRDGKASTALPAAFTNMLAPGSYQVIASAAGLTPVAQHLIIGPGIFDMPFFRMLHGDMGFISTTLNINHENGIEALDARLHHLQKFGVNFIVERLGGHLQRQYFDGRQFHAQVAALHQRLSDDPLATAPEKARLALPIEQTFAGYSAAGVQHMSIFLNNDAGVKLGTGFDNRSLEEMTADFTRANTVFAKYPAFRGWNWANMWWFFNSGGANAAQTPEERAAYLAALRRADDTGEWDPLLDTVANRMLQVTKDSVTFLDALLRPANPQLTTAIAGPYRKVEAYPPADFALVDEVDLHYQAEQITAPHAAPHNVDYYTRPGKRAWAHPEAWNDAGTGEQFLTMNFLTAMRGADGIGLQFNPPPWGRLKEDDRLSNRGYLSVFRAMNVLFTQYGPWMAAQQNADQVALIASSRMLRTDVWASFMGRHFSRLAEAYTALLHNHTPARILFTEDLSPETLTSYKAVLLVDHRYQLEPALTTALQRAKAAGVAIYYDATSRAEFMTGFEKIPLEFTHFERGEYGANHNDIAWKNMVDYVQPHLTILRDTIGTTAPPVVRLAHDQVYLTERRSGVGRFLYLVNNTAPDLQPSQLWRMTLYSASRVPVVTEVTLPDDAGFIYDVFAMRQIIPQNGVLTADLRTLPMRVYALLPQPIARVGLRGPRSVNAGQTFEWRAWVQNDNGVALNTGLPVRARLLAGETTLLEEHFAVADGDGASGTCTVPFTSTEKTLTLEVTELCSGKTARLAMSIVPAPTAMSLAGMKIAQPAATAEERAIGTETTASSPISEFFGPHLRSLAVSPDGSTAIFSAMNWDNNFYLLNLTDGDISQRGHVGDYFAFSPQATTSGYAVQGFDFNSAEGYHLYMLGADGRPQRRFALYGLPNRLPHRFVPFITRPESRINNFAVSADGKWIAAAGDLGLAVWNDAGLLLWSQDWWKTTRQQVKLATLNADTLVTADRERISAYHAADGTLKWQVALPDIANIHQLIPSRDGRTLAIITEHNNGQVIVLRDGRLLQQFALAEANECTLSDDGALLAVTAGQFLTLYSVDDGLRWAFCADQYLRFPRIAPDGRRIAVSSDDGMLTVFGVNGEMQHQRDLLAVAALSWLPDGDLLLGTWMGQVLRLDDAYRTRWQTALLPEVDDARLLMPGDAQLPTVRIEGWGNALAAPLPVEENLLKDLPTTVTIVNSDGRQHQLQQSALLMIDGQSVPPAQPWLSWNTLETFAEQSPINYLFIDTRNVLLRVNAITLVEDAAHADSWLRDAQFEFFDIAKGEWMHLQSLLSNAAVHTHQFAAAVESTRFRLRFPHGLPGNLRLAEVSLHGERLGSSHPDVRAGRAVAVLFDDNLDDMNTAYQSGHNPTYRTVSAADAYSGASYLVHDRARAQGRTSFGPQAPAPHWGFTIAQTPTAGQYRYLQLAVKAMTAETSAALLYPGQPDTTPVYTIPLTQQGWQLVRIDLWEFMKDRRQDDWVLSSLVLGSPDGSVAFDQIVLARSLADLEGVAPLP